jgi:hypothetical protein
MTSIIDPRASFPGVLSAAYNDYSMARRSQNRMLTRILHRFLILLCVAPLLCRAQLTTEQKTNDFRQIAAFYQRSYGPVAWKKQLFGFDLFDMAPWLNRVAKSTDDLGFYEICVEYVASLNDGHSRFSIAGMDWSANLGFDVDNYDAGHCEACSASQACLASCAIGKILIDKIDRGRLPSDQFPFQIGDELLSVDGVGVEAWIERLSKWVSDSNPRSKRSSAAQLAVSRLQRQYPRAPSETGDTAAVTVRRQSGAIESYTVKWLKTGTPLVAVGPVHDTLAATPKPDSSSLRASTEAPGSLAPIFVMPPGFQQRLGKPGDPFYSGIFPSAGLRIGYLRIPQLIPPGPMAGGQVDPSAGVAVFAPEIAYMQANTDGLVLDIMHNPGGAPDYSDALFSYLSPKPYQQLQMAWRPTLLYISRTNAQLTQAKAGNADQETVSFYQKVLDQAETAYKQGAALAPPVPVLGTNVMRDPAKDSHGNVLAYTKPIMLLINEHSFSAADHFAALFQDNQRGLVFGIRTGGGGGIAAAGSVAVYLQGTSSGEISLIIRNHVVTAPGYPPTSYVDSVGVHPDFVADLMTRENLMNHGATFSQAMAAAVTNYIQSSK